MSADDFIDTNVIVYMFDDRNPEKQQRADSLVRQSSQNKTGCISYQVVQETINVLTGRLRVRPETVRQMLDEILVPMWQVNPSLELYQHGLNLQSRYRFSFYDSLIVAAALEAGCSRLYTEDLQNGQRIHQLTIQDPFME